MSLQRYIAVAGAGVAGLAAATLLARQGHRVTVFDQFARPAPVGSGLVIQPVGQAVLAELGCLDRAVAQGAMIWRMEGREVARGARVLDVAYGAPGDESFGLALHRATLFEALMGALPEGVALETGCKVTGRTGGHLVFEGGRRVGPFDLIVDATGAGSPLSPLRSRGLGYGALWGWVDWPADTALDPGLLHQRYRRADRMAGVLPIGQVPGESGAKATIFWSLASDGYAAWRARGLAAWQEEAADFWPEFARFSGQVREAGALTMARYSHGTMRRPVSDGMAHIGDAAHRASPQLGQGANMGLLDAMALARAMEEARGDVPLALGYYVAARRWHVRIYQLMSWAFTPQYQSDSRVLPVLRDRLLFPLSQVPPLPRVLTRLVRGDMIPPLGALGARLA